MRRSSCPEYLFLAAAINSGLLAIAIFCFLLVFSLPMLVRGELSDLLLSPWAPANGMYGIAPMIRASLLLSGLALAIGLPVSLGVSSIIAVLAPVRLRHLLLNGVRLMASIPTVVYSFAALFLLVPLMRRLLHGSGLSLLTAAPVLALLIAPTMIIFFVSSFTRIPRNMLLAADALGATGAQKLLYIILPGSLPGIINGLLLGFGRAMGDTLVSLMLAGNSTAPPSSLAEPARTLTAHIALVMAADFDSMEFKSIFVCGLLLYSITAILMFCFRLVTRQGKNHAHSG